MKKLVAGLFISLDGITESPNQWQFDNFDEDMEAIMSGMIADADTCLLGRVTYQDWEPFWPTSKIEPFASFINNVSKIVVSTTLNEVTWGEFDTVTLLKGNLTDEITKLKEEPGKTITVAGSPTLVRSLLQEDLIDELTLTVHPVVVGKGKHLFTELDFARLGSVAKRLYQAVE